MFDNSEKFLRDALQYIPIASQTFTKSLIQIPRGVSPFFVNRAEGCHFWDIDGNRMLDFCSGLLCVLLGYGDADINAAVKRQLDDGVTFSLPHTLELKVAKKIVDMVPSAEMVRFAKNGSDATSAAIRLARAFTGREHVAVCGYHGWHDWYIGSTLRDKGVPSAVKSLTQTFKYNDLESLEKIFAAYPDKVAAVILEPMSIEYPEDDYLHNLKKITHKHGALLVFDEVITGFRFAKGGAQELFGVTPDLTAIGKGMANGFPLSALVGPVEIMNVVEDIFFSGTFGGEALSLAACDAVLDKIQQQPVIEHIHAMGQRLKQGVTQLIQKHKLQDVLSIAGHPAWTVLQFKSLQNYSDWMIKTYWLQELFAKNIFCLCAHNINFAHQPEHIDELLQAYDHIMFSLRESIHTATLQKQLRCEQLKPLFRVRDL